MLTVALCSFGRIHVLKTESQSFGRIHVLKTESHSFGRIHVLKTESQYLLRIVCAFLYCRWLGSCGLH